MPLLTVAGSTPTFSMFAVNQTKRCHNSKIDNTKFYCLGDLTSRTIS